jgi:Meiotically up-regulated gene 113
MLYFIKSGDKIKIGRGKPLSRFRAISTASPEPCELLLMISVPNEIAAEQAMHNHFSKHRCNGEWFDINFASAFRALLDLRLIPEHEQPHLEVPVISPVHPMFVDWFIATGDRPELWSKEELETVKANPDSYWQEHHERFEASLCENHTLEEMIRMDKWLSDEEGLEYFRRLKEQLAEEGAGRCSELT